VTRAGTLRRAARLPLVLAASVALVASLTAAPATAAPPSPTPTPGAPSPRPPAPVPPLPASRFGVTITPRDGAVVGIAYPITAKFTAPVTDRALAEHNMHVYVNGKRSSGAWYWKTSTTALFRTMSFWPGHATLQVRLTLGGVELGHTAKVRYVGSSVSTRTHTIRTPRALVAKVDGVTHRFVVRIDGKTVKNFATSLGKPGFETRSGIKAVMEKYPLRHMTSVAAGITDPGDQYDLQVPWAVRITPTGEFVHGAPWALGRLGRYNGSHGCTNLNVADSHWFFDQVIPGDPVVTTGTPRTMEYWNGTGAPYNIPWAVWLSHSALKGKA
jgi:lipoprotein-anchoring transpeptidase ErfK/SrfK